jgi:hypothetical protein
MAIKKLVLITCFLTHHFILSSQNLVRNGGFERWKSWTEYAGNTLLPKYWNSINGRMRLAYMTFSVNLNDHRSHSNSFGNQLPNHGNNYSVISPVGQSLQGTFLTTKLSEELIKDSLYYVEFNVSRCDYSCVTTSLLEMCFTKESNIHKWNYELWKIGPSFSNPLGVIEDSLNWTQIGGIYKAKGGERFLTLGSFHPQNEMTFKMCDWENDKERKKKPSKYDFREANYFLDDILVKPFGWNAKHDSSNNKRPVLSDIAKSEFVFRLNDEKTIEFNEKYYENIVRDLKKKEFSFVEICCSTLSNENDPDLAEKRAEMIKKKLINAGAKETEISISSHCNNQYKVRTLENDGIPMIVGVVEVVLR